MLLEISPIGTSEFSVSSYFYLLYANPFYSHPSDSQSVFTFWLGNHSLYTGPQGRDGQGIADKCPFWPPSLPCIATMVA
jgi:hypothetical protein